AAFIASGLGISSLMSTTIMERSREIGLVKALGATNLEVYLLFLSEAAIVGVIGGLLGGLLFDPIDLLLLGADKPSSHWSRLVGIVLVGGSVGAMIGVVELLARDAWLRMVEGPLAGKEFLIFKDTMHLGSSPRSEIYLFNDEDVAAQHGIIRGVGSNYEIENLCREEPLLVNGAPITRTRLRNGDQITIGRTVFVFQRRKG
ncbi:hypothetical protein LCGC14_1964230, partial [marine sediment metagenome]